ncbi:hypothetical protein GCM10028801_07290 [Nocardioides maradonensis]
MATAKKTTTTTSTAKKAPAKKTAQPSEAHLTNYLSDLIDTTKNVVDDLLESAGKVETSARTRSKEARDKLIPSDADIKRLRKRAKELTDQVEKLARLREKKSK